MDYEIQKVKLLACMKINAELAFNLSIKMTTAVLALNNIFYNIFSFFCLDNKLFQCLVLAYFSSFIYFSTYCVNLFFELANTVIT